MDVSVASGLTDGCAWTLWRRATPRRHAGALARAVWFEGLAGGRVRRVEPAATTVTLILNLAEPYEIAGGRETARVGSFVAGLWDRPAVVDGPARERCLQLDLTPLGALRLFRTPPSAYGDAVIDAADLLGRDTAPLLDALATAPDAAARLALVDRLLDRRLAEAPAASPEIAWAHAVLSRTGGRARIGALAARLGWSRGRLAERFRAEIGATPKRFARVLRFAAARRLLDAGLPAAATAAAAGYADQAHLIREARALAGATPARLAAASGPP